MKCSLDISNYVEEMSRLPHSVVFLYFFALVTEESFLISPCYSLELCIQMNISFLFSFAFPVFFFSQLFVKLFLRLVSIDSQYSVIKSKKMSNDRITSSTLLAPSRSLSMGHFLILASSPFPPANPCLSVFLQPYQLILFSPWLKCHFFREPFSGHSDWIRTHCFPCP